MPDAVFIYITTPTREEAEKIGRTLVNEKLAACVNVIPGMRSIYRWQDRVETAHEVVLIVKTRASKFDAVAEKVKGLHAYTNPCIVAFPVVAGTADYLDWIRESTTEQK